MAAIITDQFRKNNIETFVKDISDSPAIGGHNYYVGIGKTDPYPTIGNLKDDNSNYPIPLPISSTISKDDVKNNLMTLIKVDGTDVKRLIPKVAYEFNKQYKVYDPSDPSCFDYNTDDTQLPCYVTYTDGDNHTKLYVCLGNNNNAFSTSGIPAMSNPTSGSNFPFGVEQNLTSAGKDGYIWAYVDYLDTDDPNNLFADSKSFQTLSTDSEVDAKVNSQQNHLGISDGRTRATRATAGLLYGFKIKDAGAGYPMGSTTVGDTKTFNAKIVGERIKNSGDGGGAGVGTGEERIGDEIATGSENSVSIDAVVTAEGGKITGIQWDLAKAKALGYGRTDTVNSAGSTVTGLSIQDAGGFGGIKRARVVFTDSEVQPDVVDSTFRQAEIVPLIAPEFGFGHSPLTDLPSYYCGVSANFEGTVGENSAGSNSPPQFVAEALVDVKFRQVSLIKEKTGESLRIGEDDSPWTYSGGTPPITSEKALNCLPYFFIPWSAANGSSKWAARPGGLEESGRGVGGDGIVVELAGGTVSGGGEPPRAFVDKVSAFELLDPADTDPATGGNQSGGGFRIYYHQNSSNLINQAPFPIPAAAGTQIAVYNEAAGRKNRTLLEQNLYYTFIGNPEYERTRGEVLFIEDRKPLERDAQQTEEVRLIIQF